MLFSSKNKKALITIIGILLIVSLACGSSADDNGDADDVTDLAATADALQATQDAIGAEN